MKTKFASFLVAASFSTLAACGGTETPVDQPKTGTTVADTPSTAKPIPEGFTAITPVLVVSDVDKALAFYAEALGASTKLTLPGPEGKTAHAEMQIGDSIIMLSAEDPITGAKSPTTLGGTNGSLLVYVEDTDSATKTAVDAGATLVMPAADMFWGDRYAGLVDPFGHMWGISTHLEEVSAEEMATRGAAWVAAAQAGKQYKTPAVTTPAKSFRPEGYKSVTVTILLAGGADDLSFYKTALGAEVADEMPMPDGRLMHASLNVGGDVLHVSSEFPQMTPTHKAAVNLGGSPVGVYFYGEAVDDTHAAMTAAGAQTLANPADVFWGDRWGLVTDPAGNRWGIATHKEDLTSDEVISRMKKAMEGKTEAAK